MGSTFDDSDESPASAEDVAISRIADGAAGAEDWDQLEAVAVRDRAVWERLARALKVEAELRRGLDGALGIADAVELPLPAAQAAVAAPRTLRSHLGWVAACVFAVLWLSPMFSAGSVSSTEDGVADSTATLQPVNTEDALERYLVGGIEDGSIVGQLPRRVVRTTPAGRDGAVEVLYVRRILEKAIVDQFYEVGHDEHGTPTSLPVSNVRLASYESL